MMLLKGRVCGVARRRGEGPVQGFPTLSTLNRRAIAQQASPVQLGGGQCLLPLEGQVVQVVVPSSTV